MSCYQGFKTRFDEFPGIRHFLAGHSPYLIAFYFPPNIHEISTGCATTI